MDLTRQRFGVVLVSHAGTLHCSTSHMLVVFVLLYTVDVFNLRSFDLRPGSGCLAPFYSVSFSSIYRITDH
jgi:hypothetical protein